VDADTKNRTLLLGYLFYLVQARNQGGRSPP